MRVLDAEVIVVGGGPAGASTAHFLARAGLDVLVLERARYPRDKTCAEYLSPQASRVLAAIGALDRGRGGRGGAARRDDRARPERGADPRRVRRRHGFAGFRDRGLALPRRILDEILIRCAEDAGRGCGSARGSPTSRPTATGR
jgi:2-polyprenyl-6-methoxyphenol hydroxylase-like FAD-dependent oxidoreductase